MEVRRELHLVSPIFPSGVAYVLNILIELDIRIFRDGMAETFVRTPDGHVLVESQSELKRWMPTLATTPAFRFAEPVTVRWFHKWPSPGAMSRPAALLVRNGADAIFSYHKRNVPSMSFADFLARPFRLEHHRRRLLPYLIPTDAWALFCLVWRRILGPDGCVVGFEAMKTDPVPEVQRLLAHLGVARTAEEIRRAAERSTFERARREEEKFIRARGLKPVSMMNRRGQVDEWKETYGAAERKHFRGLPDHALAVLGYPALGGAGKGAPEPGTIGALPAAVSCGLAGACERARRGDVAAARRLFSTAAGSIDGSPEQALLVGMSLACCDWTQTLEGRGRFPVDVRRALLGAFLEETPRLDPGPAVRSLAARSLAHAGHGAAARVLVELAASEARENFNELLGVADCCHKCGFRSTRRALLDRLADLATSEERRASLDALRGACRPLASVRWRLARSTRRLGRKLGAG